MQKHTNDYNSLAIFTALSNQTRLAIIEELAHAPRSATELSKQQKMSLQALHKHTKLLQSSGVIVAKKEGTVTYYALQKQALLVAQKWLARYSTYLGNPHDDLEIHIYNKK